MSPIIMYVEVIMDDSNWMDCSLSDVPMHDPFLSLSLPFQADLCDISDVIRRGDVPEQMSPNVGVDDYFNAHLGDNEKLEINCLVSAMERESTHFLAHETTPKMIVHPMRQTTSSREYQSRSPAPPPPPPYLQSEPMPMREYSTPSFIPPSSEYHPPISQYVPPISQYVPPMAQYEPPPTSIAHPYPVPPFANTEFIKSEPPRLVKKETPPVELTMEDCQKIEAVKTLASLGPDEVNRLVKLASSSADAGTSSNSTKVGIATKISGAEKVKRSPVAETTSALSVDTSANSSGGVSPNNFGYDSGDESDNSQSINFSSKQSKRRGVGKTERRSAHNLIEKKYRCSINDKISELKDLIGGNEPKMSKSVILKKSVDYIYYLRSQNENLKRRNNELKQALSAKGEPVPVSPVGDSPSSPDTRSDSSSPPPRSSKRNPKPMPDSSRVTLFVFMMGIMLVNPLSLIINTGPVSPSANVPRPNSRTLLSATFDEPEDWWWHDRLFRVMCMWLLNGMIIACVLARIFIYGEPVMSSESQSWMDLSRLRHKAKSAAHQGDWATATEYLCDCLRQLGRPPPSCTLDQWAAFLWQIFRQFLHRLWIGEYLSKQRRGGLKSHSVMQSHAQTALIYKELLEINLISQSKNLLNCLTTALSAVNLAEASGGHLPGEQLIEIYVLARVQLQTTLGSRFTLLHMYLMRCAQSSLKKSDIALPPHLIWIFSPIAADFLSSNPSPSRLISSTKNNFFPFCLPSKESLYLGPLTAEFKCHLLNKLSEAQLYCDKSNKNVWTKTINGLSVFTVMEWCDLLLECSKDDHLCTWWTQLLTSAVCWASGNREGASNRYKIVRVIPKELLADNLALSLGHAFCARRMCVDGCTSDKYEKVVWFHCSNARRTLRQLILNLGVSDMSTFSIANNIRLLSYGWLQCCCLDVWLAKVPENDSYWIHPTSSALQQLFGDCLSECRHLMTHPDAHAKLLLLESMGRMLSGANPVHTNQYLKRCANVARAVRTITDTDLKYLNQLMRMHTSIACL